jgi:hypothetical protein
MQHEGMVHALHEIQRVLAPNGILIDLRPASDHWPVEVVSSKGFQETGRVQDLPIGLADDEASNQSIAQAAEKGWFVKEQEDFFPFFYSWDSPNEMEDYIKNEWEDFIGLENETLHATRSAWAIANADARVRVRMKMLIARWRKNQTK